MKKLIFKSVSVIATCCYFVSAAWAQGDVVRLGQIVPLSGPLANVGKEIKAATEAAIAQHNATSKPLIELLVEDDGNNPERSAAAVESLNGRAVALLSCFGTVGCLAQMKGAQSAGMPLIGPIAGAPQLRGRNAVNVFAVRASASEELARMVQFSQTMSLRQWAVVVQDDGFGQSYWEALKPLLVNSGIQIQSATLLNPQNPDYAANVAELTKAQPNSLLLLANATHSVGVLKAWREKKSLPFVMNLSGQANGIFAGGLKGYTGAAAFVTATPSPWGKKYGMQREYQAGMQAAGLSNFSYLSFEAYTNARIAIDAIMRAKGRSPAAIKAALDHSTFMVAGIEWRFDSKSQGRYTDMAVLKSDGTFIQ